MTTRSILCPVDFGAASLASIPLAAEQAKFRDATLHLLHVWQPGLEYAGEGPPIPFAAELPKEKIESDLASLDVDLPPEQLQRHVSSGDPAKDIIELAEALDSELVVMGTHARGGLRRWIIGSVCEVVLRHCPCPVLVCRGPEQRGKD
jgi:nucleotide-binding universal stress UspA family protein